MSDEVKRNLTDEDLEDVSGGVTSNGSIGSNQRKFGKHAMANIEAGTRKKKAISSTTKNVVERAGAPVDDSNPQIIVR